MACLLASAVGTHVGSAFADFSNLVQSVSNVVFIGSPGALFALDQEWTPTVAGDDDSSFPSTVVLARTFGSGRVLAMGHDGLVGNLDKVDNRQFMVNVMEWLDASATKSIVYSTNHSEWVGAPTLASLESEMEGRGYAFQAATYPLSTNSLSGKGVLIVGNAWGAFQEAEITAVESFVSGGNGVLFLGLGWSWEPYHPGTTIEDYPMTKITAPYGIRWLRNVISDPTDQYEGYPLFHTFYPAIFSWTVSNACAYISSTHASHPSDLAATLETNATIRRDYVRAHLTLKTSVSELTEGHPQRAQVYDYYKEMVASNITTFGKSPAMDASSYPTLTRIRERVFRTWIDALPLDAARKTEIASVAGLSGRYLDLWSEFGVWLLDNYSLDAAQQEALYRYLSLIPSGLHNLRAISVTDFLGSCPVDIPLDGANGGVNIFGGRIPDYAENPFPADVTPGWVSTFCDCAAHEINHVVDTYAMAHDAGLAARRAALITSAGTNHMNYLCSMFGDGFFTSAPWEFFASIANQWFTDSAKTFELGLVRLGNGYADPINQAVFLAGVYAQGGDHTYFYTTDTSGNTERRTVPLVRNAMGHIIGLFFAGHRYEFTVDDDGDVQGWTVTNVSPTITGIHILSPYACDIVAQGQTGSVYVLQCTTNLAVPAAWTNQHSCGADAPEVRFTYTNHADCCFYRILVQ